MEYRVGIGYDVHRLVEGRPLILGGVNISYGYGLLGHSDADVLIHAVMDSLIGAMSKGDIGRIFPDNDEKYKDISSMVLLGSVYEIMIENMYEIVNIDTIIIAQRPKLSPYYQQMASNIAGCLKTPLERINIKATTEEGLGFTGEGQGIAAKAVAMIKRYS